jgi:hypothetical protein
VSTVTLHSTPGRTMIRHSKIATIARWQGDDPVIP